MCFLDLPGDADDIKPKLLRTSKIVEIVTISDSESDADDKSMDTASNTAKAIPPAG